MLSILWSAQLPPAIHSFSRILLTLLLLTIPVRVSAHGGHGDEFQGSQAAQSAGAIQVDATTARRMGLKVQAVTRQQLAIGIRATGQIEALPNKQVEVTNPVGGTVIRLFVQPGDPVRAGQPVALLSSPDLAELRVSALEKRAEGEADVRQAQADLQLALENYQKQQQVAAADIQQARIALNFAQERYDRDKELLEQGAIPRRQVLESQTQLAEAKAGLTKATSRLQVAEATAQLKRARSQVAVAQSRVDLSSATYQSRLRQLGASPNPDGTITIVAPISGMVADREVTLGQSAQDAGAKLMTLVDNRIVLATANIYEKDLNQIAKGQPARVTVAGLPNRTFSGRITVIGSVVEGETRIVPVKAELVNPSGVLKPGMFATLELLTDQTATTLSVPASALVEANGRQRVYVQNGQSFEPVDVELGRTVGDRVEIKSGLFEGDNVVVQGAPMLYAQSLRGGSNPEAEADAPTETNPTAVGTSVPWWAMVPVSGGIVALTFWSGMYWANRRQRRGLTAISRARFHPEIENSPNGSQPLPETAYGLPEVQPGETKAPRPPSQSR